MEAPTSNLAKSPIRRSLMSSGYYYSKDLITKNHKMENRPLAKFMQLLNKTCKPGYNWKKDPSL